jgi:hypothetical protein
MISQETAAQFLARMVHCMTIQNAKNTATPELLRCIEKNPQKIFSEALNYITAGFGIFTAAGIDPLPILTDWMNAVEAQSA